MEVKGGNLKIEGDNVLHFSTIYGIATLLSFHDYILRYVTLFVRQMVSFCFVLVVILSVWKLPLLFNQCQASHSSAPPPSKTVVQLRF